MRPARLISQSCRKTKDSGSELRVGVHRGRFPEPIRKTPPDVLGPMSAEARAWSTKGSSSRNWAASSGDTAGVLWLKSKSAGIGPSLPEDFLQLRPRPVLALVAHIH